MFDSWLGGLKIDLPDFRSLRESFVHDRRHGHGFCCIMPSFLETRLCLILPESVTVSFPCTSLTVNGTCGRGNRDEEYLPAVFERMALFVLDLYTAAVTIFTGEDARSGVELDDFEWI